MTIAFIWIAILTALVVASLAGDFFAGSKEADRQNELENKLQRIRSEIDDINVFNHDRGKHVDEVLDGHSDHLQEANRLIADASFRLDEIEEGKVVGTGFRGKINRLHDDVYSKGGLTFLRDSAHRVKELEARIFDIENKDSEWIEGAFDEPERELYGYGIVLANVGVPFDKCRVWSTKKGAERFIERSGGVYGSLAVVPLSFESDA